MTIEKVSAGKELPMDINVIIEIPAHSSPVKYEIDKDSGYLTVDRFIDCAMFYPANYGFVNHTLSLDGDPVDVLVITDYPLEHNSVIRCRPVGVLKMEDDSGMDAKIIAVPHSKLTRNYDHIKDIQDLPIEFKNKVQHFFENYKTLTPGKWVKILGWDNVEAAAAEISESFERAKK